MSIMLFQLTPLPYMLAVNTPETCEDAQYARCESNIVRRSVTLEPQLTSALTIRFHHRVRVIYSTIEEIVDVAAHDGCQGHETPVDSEAIGAESIDDKRRENAKQNTICKTGESGYSPQMMRVFNADGSDLSQSKNGG